MANTNYTVMSNRDLLDEINKLGIYQGKLNAYLKKHFPNLFNELVSRTYFLDDFYKDKSVPIPTRLYCLEHDLKEQPKCQHPDCNNPVKWNSNTNSFMLHCCNTHSKSDPKFWEKVKETNLKRYDVVHKMCLCEVQQKAKETCRRLYNNDYPMQCAMVHNKQVNTCMSKYNIHNVSQIDWVKEKVRSSFIEHYGVDNYAQSVEYHKKAHKPYMNPKYPDMTFGSSWEFKVYDFLLENHIDFEYQPAISLSYEYKETHHTYHPDFLINGKVYEVKGDNFFRINESTGQEEMFCPYRNKDWPDEKYDWMCGLYEAKYQCMLANDVVILRSTDIKNISLSTFGIGV